MQSLCFGYDELDKQFHIDTSHIKIEFVHWENTSTIAACGVDHGTKPQTGRFQFNTVFLSQCSQEDRDDTILHEYAHAGRCSLRPRIAGRSRCCGPGTAPGIQPTPSAGVRFEIQE